MNQSRNRSTIVYVIFFAAIMFLVIYQFRQSASAQETLSINQVATDLQAGKISRISEDDNRLIVIYNDDGKEMIGFHFSPVNQTKRLQFI